MYQKHKRYLPRRMILISVNRLAFYKRNDLAVKAAAKLGLKYWIIGEGKEKEKLKSNNVILFGNLPHAEVLEKYKHADIFCLPSEVEGFGIATLEAMSAGLPFVNSDIPVHQEIEKASHAGLLFKSGDYHDLADKLEILIKDKKLYSKLSNNALFFAKKYSLDRMVRETEKIYENLLSH